VRTNCARWCAQRTLPTAYSLTASRTLPTAYSLQPDSLTQQGKSYVE